jgi:ElaB/YqjD/DUF883 family membrane-anchored ribosome-binding protein
MSTQASQKLVTDLKVLAADTQELIRATAEQSGEKVNVAREKARAAIAQAQARVAAAEALAVERARVAIRTTDEYAHGHPWALAGMVGLVAFAVGYIAGRK